VKRQRAEVFTLDIFDLTVPNKAFAAERKKPRPLKSDVRTGDTYGKGFRDVH